MIITSLAENTSCREDIGAEHGLSLYIQTNNAKILFDMGQTSLFAENAEKLGVDLSSIDIAVLSHGHYDHGGGLGEFIKLNAEAKIYMSENAFLPYYNGTQKYIGLDTALQRSERIVFVGDEYRINGQLTLHSCNNKRRNHSFGSFGLTEKVGESFVPDSFRHEIYLLIEENGKRYLISGCSHKGILDIVEWFSPDVLIGGFHFSKMPLDETLTAAALALDSYPTDFYTCHCTGIEQYRFMRSYMKRLDYFPCGHTITI